MEITRYLVNSYVANQNYNDAGWSAHFVYILSNEIDYYKAIRSALGDGVARVRIMESEKVSILKKFTGMEFMSAALRRRYRL